MTDIKLFPHNRDTYHKIQEMWQTTNRVAVIQATGTGKSFLILKCLFDIPNENKVVLAPSEYIFEQLEENVDENIPKTQFITYMKLSYMTEDEIKKLKPSLIVLDEFHRCGAEEWGRGVKTLLNAFPQVRVLGTSATPIRYLDNERDMSDELFEGNVAVNLSLAEAIVKGILPMPKYISALYTFEDEAENIKNKVMNSHNSDEEKDELLKQIDLMRNKLDKSKGIPQILKKYLIQSNSKYIVFCKNKEHLHEMKLMVVNWFKKAKLANKIETYIVYTGYKNTDQEFEAFKNNKSNSLKLLFSIEMLNEGLHIDDITGVILLRPTVSPIIYYQQIGRAIDAGNSEQPIIFDFVNNFDSLGAKQFITDLNEYREKEVKLRQKNDNENIDIKEFIIYDEILEVKELFKDMELNLHLRGDWDGWHKQLMDYYLENNNIDIPQTYINNNGIKLGKWLNSQRLEYKKGKLSKEKINLLEDIGIKWHIRNEWYYYYDLLIKFKLINGHVNVPYKTLFEDYKLGQWVSIQRTKYRKNILLDEYINLLDEIGFEWEVDEKKWDMFYDLLIDYKLENKKLNLQHDEIYKGYEIGKWVTYQKIAYLKNRLSQERINKLKNLGFIWDVRDDNWEIMFSYLVKFKEEYNHINVTQRYINNDNIKLGLWVSTQKRVYKKGKLSNERIEKLESIGFKWDKHN